MGLARAAWRAPLTAMPAGHLRKGASSRGRSDRAARAGALARRRDRRVRGGVFSWRRRGRSALRSELLGDRSGRNPRGQASKAAGSRLRRGVVQGWSTVYWGAWRRGRGGPGRGLEWKGPAGTAPDLCDTTDLPNVPAAQPTPAPGHLALRRAALRAVRPRHGLDGAPCPPPLPGPGHWGLRQTLRLWGH